MIKTLIIDDEKDARFILRNLLNKKFGHILEVIGEAEDVAPALEAIQKLKPDLVFLDIQMRKGTGFDLLRQIKKIDFEVIFVTAHNQFGVEAFKLSAFGYLLKPINSKDLAGVLKKLQSHIHTTKNKGTERLKVLIENYGSDGKMEKLIIPNVKGFQIVKISNIIRLEGDRNYSHFILLNGKKITTSKSLGEYEELLSDYGFFRIHQSTIVSLRHISSYIKGDGGLVKTVDDAELKLSRHRKAEFIKRFL